MAYAQAAESRERFRKLNAGPTLHLVPGVTNVLDARAAERIGFEAVFLTGAGIANTMFGYPDIGLVTLSEVVDAARRIARGTRLPVIADADTGYGNHLNVIRTVTELQDAGVAAIVLEDQVAPKKCGHFDGKRVVPTGEMVEKLVAARMARHRSRPDPGRTYGRNRGRGPGESDRAGQRLRSSRCRRRLRRSSPDGRGARGDPAPGRGALPREHRRRWKHASAASRGSGADGV